MNHRIARRLTLVSLLAAASAAWAGVDAEVGNGDKVTGTLDPASETEVFRFRVPKGAVITIRAKAAKTGPELHLRARDPAGAELSSTGGRAVTVGGITAGASGLHSVEVTSQDGAATGDYALSVTWKSPTSFSVSAEIAAAASATLDFAADAGAAVTLTAKPGRGSSAVAVIEELTAPDMSVAPLAGASAKRTLAAGGDYVLTFGNGGAAAGVVTAGAKVKPPKAKKRKIALTANVIGAAGGSDFATAAVLGAGGGTFSVPFIPDGQPGAEISGSSVSVPPGSLAGSTAILIATAPDIAAPGGSAGAGPTVLFGPEGVRFDTADKSARATITIPFNSAAFADTSLLQIFTRDAKGKVTLVPPPYTFDAMAGTVSVTTSHFSSFRAVGPVGGTVQAAIFTVATLPEPLDVCNAFDPAAIPNPILLYVAEGNQPRVVGALRASATQTSLVHEVWAGGGNQTADGTFRTSFQFNDAVVSVDAAPDGEVWIATLLQIFHVDAQGIVTRVAGTGTPGGGGDNGPAIGASFTNIRSILVTLNHDLFVADSGTHRIRFIDAAAGNTITAWAGDGTVGIGLDGVDPASTSFIGPFDMAFGGATPGLYVADGARVRLINPGASGFTNQTVAGDPGGSIGSGGNGGPPAQARFESIEGISQDIDPFNPSSSRFVVTDAQDHTIRRIDLTNDIVTPLAGMSGEPGFNGEFGVPPGELSQPGAIIASPGFYVFCDQGNGRVRALVLPVSPPKR